MTLALYRKYRPATFAEVVGQEHVTDPLRTALAAGRINHAYLFSGPRGCGKTSSARILARSLNCEQGPTPDPCGVCSSCIALAPEGPGSLDVVELDAASHGGVDDTRELRDRAFYMPAESRYRVFIIDEAHMVTTQGFNALLKIVEEPPEHLVFIFATTEPDKVLTTIRSRTHHYPFRLIPPATLRALLERLCAEEGVTVEPSVFPLVIQAGGGSARDSLSVLDQLLAGAGPEGVTYRNAVALLGVTDAALLDEVVDALAAGDGASVFGAVDRVAEAGHDPRRFAADLLQRMRDLVILAAVPEAVDKGLISAPGDQLDAMAAQAGRLGAATLSRFADVLHTGLVEMRGTTAPRLVLELMCARMLLPEVDTGAAALLQRLERLERHGTPAGPARAAAGSEAGQADRGAAEPPPPAPAREFRRPEPARSAEPTEPAAPARSAPGRADPEPAGGPDLGLPAPPTRRPAAPAAAGPDLGLPAPPQRRASASRAAADGPDLGLPNPPGARPAGGSEEPGRRERPAERTATRPEAAAPPPVPTPAAPAPTGGGAQIDAADLRRRWPEVLSRIQAKRRTTAMLLELATVAGVSAGTLQLTMTSAGLARRVMEPANAEMLRAALKDVLGADLMIKCGTADQAAAPSTRPAPAARQEAPRRQPASGPSDIPPPPEPDPYDDIPDDYDSEPDPSAPPPQVRDPEQVAIELLTEQLGARRLEGG